MAHYSSMISNHKTMRICCKHCHAYHPWLELLIVADPPGFPTKTRSPSQSPKEFNTWRQKYICNWYASSAVCVCVSTLGVKKCPAAETLESSWLETMSIETRSKRRFPPGIVRKGRNHWQKNKNCFSKHHPVIKSLFFLTRQALHSHWGACSIWTYLKAML